MTNENKIVETQDVASPSTRDNQTDAPTREEVAEESVGPAAEEEEAVQAEPVPFEEDAAPAARTDDGVAGETEEVVKSDATQEATAPSPAEETVAEPVQESEAAEGESAVAAEQAVEGAEQPPEAPAANPQSEIPNPQSEVPNPQSDESPTVESVIEAILFATDEPLTDGKLAGIVETSAKQVRECVDNLNTRYAANHNAFRIEQIAGGYQMLTLNIYNSWLKKMLHARSDNKLSPAALETLAIIAYKQPVIRADIEAVRGVAAGEVIRSLMYKGLVKIAGRAEILGRPMLYGTTKKFLEVFGLNSLKDLPKAEELKNPDRG